MIDYSLEQLAADGRSRGEECSYIVVAAAPVLEEGVLSFDGPSYISCKPIEDTGVFEFVEGEAEDAPYHFIHIVAAAFIARKPKYSSANVCGG